MQASQQQAPQKAKLGTESTLAFSICVCITKQFVLSAGAEDSHKLSCCCSSVYLKNLVYCFSDLHALCHPSHAHKYILMSFIVGLSKQMSSFNSALHMGCLWNLFFSLLSLIGMHLSLESFPFLTDRP